MRQMQGVLWTKGLILSPQHLQTQDRFLETLVSFRVGALTPFPWGFLELVVDQGALEDGRLALTRASGLLPDGAPFDMPVSEELPPPRPFDQHWHHDADSLTIHLTLPEGRPGGRNVSDEGVARYRPEVLLRRDEMTGRGEKPVQVARRNFRFVLEGETLDGLVSMPVARIVRTSAGFQLDPEFIPPILRVDAHPVLQGVVRRLLELVIARSSALGELRRRRNRGVASFGVSDVANFWLLFTLNEHFPGLRHFTEPGDSHPARVYDTLTSLAGSLTTFSDSVTPMDLPEYEHRELGRTFLRLERTIQELLRSVVPERHVAVPLIEGERSIFTGHLDDEPLQAGERFFLAFRDDGPAAQTINRVPESLKVGAADRVEALVNFSRPGIGLKHVAVLPAEIPLKGGFEYFEIDPSTEDWRFVRTSRTLSAFVSKEFENPALELVILLPKSES